LIEHGGKRYRRVTEVISNGEYDHIDSEVIRRAQIRGTQIHNAIADELSGEMALFDPAHSCYMQSWRRWYENTSFESFPLIEKRLFDDELMITGQIDLLAVSGGIPILYDWKTSANPSASWEYQAVFYIYLLRQNGYSVSDQAYFVRLQKDGLLPRLSLFSYRDETMDICRRMVDKINEKENKLE